MKERVVDNKYDPLVWLGRKIFRRDQLENQSAQGGGASMEPSNTGGVTGDAAGTPFSSARLPEGPPLGPDGKLDVAELLSQRAGGPSPFGDEQTFPLPPNRVVYHHPAPGKDDDQPEH
jgi:succinate dehydrogenase / fumarate reductase iron-sulfur subunit